MKLSEAILLGSISNGQAFYALKDRDGNTCAMGAAMTSIGMDIENTYSYEQRDQLPNIFPILLVPVPSLPGELIWPDYVEYKYQTVWEAIVVLNNEYKWTRPQIAAWVAEKEKELGIADMVEVSKEKGVKV